MKTIQKLFSILILLTIMVGFVTTVSLAQPTVVQANALPIESEQVFEPMPPAAEGDVFPIFYALSVNWNK